jgi:hypothetical protein
MTGSIARAAVMGKVPWHPEFLRGSQLCAELWAFDEWLFRNAQPEQSHAASAGAYGFLLQLTSTTTATSAIAGVISPSHDLAGRPYPLAIAGNVTLARDVVAHPEIVPIVFESYWQAALEILAEARVGPPEADDWHLERLSDAQMDSAQSAFDLYVDWAGGTDAGEFCARLERPAAWLAEAATAVAQATRAGNPGCVRAPLGQAGGGALCFWLDVVRRAARWQGGHVPSFFWSHDEQRGEALVFVGAPGDATLATLWGGGPAGVDLCDLQVTSGDVPLIAASPVPHADPLSTGTDGSLWPVLESVDALVKMQSL